LASNNGSQDAPQVGAGLLPSIPAMPRVSRAELYVGAPYLLITGRLRHSLGWQGQRKADPSFVVVSRSRLGAVKVKERFPMTEQGWAGAWQTLCGLDATAAAAIQAKLTIREEGSRAAVAIAGLDAESSCSLRVTFNGGSGESPLTKNQRYGLRFLGDRIIVSPEHSVDAVIEIPYRDVESVEVSGPGLANKTSGEMLALIGGLGLLGALLGLIFLGVIGLLIGAVVFALVGALIGAASSKIETTIRIRAGDTEFYFMNSEIGPDPLKIELSDALMAIRDATAAQANGSEEPAEAASGSIPDQLSKLASLLQQDVITREEFEHLKAKLIAQS
jgi:hypothetical protein